LIAPLATPTASNDLDSESFKSENMWIAISKSVVDLLEILKNIDFEYSPSLNGRDAKIIGPDKDTDCQRRVDLEFRQ
jgi:hypothetical protein